MNALGDMIRLLRPSHWVKNLFVFAALLFARQVTSAGAWTEAGIAFAAFCLVASGIYALNDVRDRHADARHPVKKRRPVAAGRVGPMRALMIGTGLIAAGLVVASASGRDVAWVVAAYAALMLAYTAGLKRVAILDVLMIASGFVLRALAGGVAINVEVSHWLLLCTLTLSLFLGFAKREGERAAVGDERHETRELTWAIYNRRALEHMMTVSAGLAIVTYMLYTVSPRTMEMLGHHWMFVTVLPVVYGVFRFYSRVITGEVTGPVDMIRRDPPFVATVLVWLAMVAGVLFAVPAKG